MCLIHSCLHSGIITFDSPSRCALGSQAAKSSPFDKTVWVPLFVVDARTALPRIFTTRIFRPENAPQKKAMTIDAMQLSSHISPQTFAGERKGRCDRFGPDRLWRNRVGQLHRRCGCQHCRPEAHPLTQGNETGSVRMYLLVFLHPCLPASPSMSVALLMLCVCVCVCVCLRELMPAPLACHCAVAHVLCNRPELVRGKSIIEVGSGTGLLGCIAGSLSPKMLCMTDLPGLVPRLEVRDWAVQKYVCIPIMNSTTRSDQPRAHVLISSVLPKKTILESPGYGSRGCRGETKRVRTRFSRSCGHAEGTPTLSW
jgi:hypothetical protein